jgi:Transposase and inactivated derivatives
MRYPASEKLEIIRTVEASHLPARQTLAMLGIPRTTYYRWYDRWSEGGLDALEDTPPHPGSVWNRLADETRADIIEFALEHEELTPRELAVKYTDEKQYFVSESSVYRILKTEDCAEFCALTPFLRHWEAVFEHDRELAFDSVPFSH